MPLTRKERLTATVLPDPSDDPIAIVGAFGTVKDLYGTLLATRNQEIGLFWQRSNYFLVLNTALALGFFKETDYAPVFAVMGTLASVLWFWVCLGGKFWQTRWEQRLMDFERQHLSGLEFFSANADRVDMDVARGFKFREQGWLKKWIYRYALLQHPSVSFSMILLSLLFLIGWSVVAVIDLTRI